SDLQTTSLPREPANLGSCLPSRQRGRGFFLSGQSEGRNGGEIVLSDLASAAKKPNNEEEENIFSRTPLPPFFVPAMRRGSTPLPRSFGPARPRGPTLPRGESSGESIPTIGSRPKTNLRN